MGEIGLRKATVVVAVVVFILDAAANQHNAMQQDVIGQHPETYQ